MLTPSSTSAWRKPGRAWLYSPSSYKYNDFPCVPWCRKVWKTCFKTLSHVSRNELANLLPPLDDLGLTPTLLVLCSCFKDCVSVSFPKDQRGSRLNIKELLVQCYHRYTKMKQNKTPLVIIWQDIAIFLQKIWAISSNNCL